MTLTKCEDCGHEVSTEAASCPNCGGPTPAARTRKSRRLIWTVVVIVLLFLFFLLLAGGIGGHAG